MCNNYSNNSSAVKYYSITNNDETVMALRKNEAEPCSEY